LGTFKSVKVGKIDGVAVDDHAEVFLDLPPVGAEAEQRQHVADTGAALGPAVNQVELTVVRPKRTRIDQSFAGHDHDRFAPRSGGIFGGDEMQSEIGVGVIDPKPSVMMTYRRRPYTAAMAGRGIV